MGNGIAHVFALAGHQVFLTDNDHRALEKAVITIQKNLQRQVEKGTITADQADLTHSRIVRSTAIREWTHPCELVIEAATENPTTKLAIFRELDVATPADTILATNTSSISITRIAAATRDPGRVIGMHFMNPVPVMKLVEVIRGYSTRKEVVQKVMTWSLELGKTPVEVNDYPGFISNRILMPMINEAIQALYEGVAGVQEIDTVMKLGMAHPMGPLQLADLIGLDVCLAILRVLQDGFGQPKYAPCPLLVNMVQAGRIGVKSKSGFYNYDHGTKELVVADRFLKN